MMWLTLLWQNKGMVALVAALAIFAVLGTALKVQSSRLKYEQKRLAEAEDQRDAAIEQHDRLVDAIARLQDALNQREAVRKQQEADNAKLRQTIKEALVQNRVWADTPVPAGVLQAMQAVPVAGDPTGASLPKTGSGVSRKDQ